MTGTLREDLRTLIIIAEFFAKRKIFQTKSAEESKTRILCSITFSPKIVPFKDNVEEYCTARQATHDKIRAQEICELHGGKVRQEYKHIITVCKCLLLLHGNIGYTKATRCYVIHTLSVLLLHELEL